MTGFFICFSFLYYYRKKSLFRQTNFCFSACPRISLLVFLTILVETPLQKCKFYNLPFLFGLRDKFSLSTVRKGLIYAPHRRKWRDFLFAFLFYIITVKNPYSVRLTFAFPLVLAFRCQSSLQFLSKHPYKKANYNPPFLFGLRDKRILQRRSFVSCCATPSQATKLFLDI